MRDCGACNLCCVLLGVPDIGKPPRMRCWNTTIHGGCRVHHLKDSDPTLGACKSFHCVWLVSQIIEGEQALPRFLRPDQCHVVFGPQDTEDPLLLNAHCDEKHPNAWRTEPVRSWMLDKLSKGARFVVHIGEQRIEVNADNYF
jgi:hypothetical protein